MVLLQPAWLMLPPFLCTQPRYCEKNWEWSNLESGFLNNSDLYPSNPDRFWDPTINYSGVTPSWDINSEFSDSDWDTVNSAEEDNDTTDDENDVLFNPKFIKRSILQNP